MKKNTLSKIWIISMIFLMIILGFITSINSEKQSNNSTNENDWWNIDWEYKKTLSINNSVNDYQKYFRIWKEDGHDKPGDGIIDCENHCNTNFSDIRFVDTNNQLLPYWIEKKDVATGGYEFFFDDFETNFFNWDEYGATDWQRTTGNSHSGDYSALCDKDGHDLISDDINTSECTDFVVSFWYYIDDIDGDDNIMIQYWNGFSYDDIDEIGDDAEDTWLYFSDTVESPEYFSSTFHIKFKGSSIDSGERLWIDDVYITDGHHYADIWVKTTQDPSLDFYYGNASAESLSNGDDTFLFFEDFNKVVLNTTKWDTTQCGWYLLEDGYIRFRGNYDNKGLVTANSFITFQMPFTVESKVRTNTYGDLDLFCRFNSLSSIDGFAIDGGNSNGDIAIFIGGGISHLGMGLMDKNWHRTSMTFQTTKFTINTDWTTELYKYGLSASSSGYIGIGADTDDSGRYGYYDWFAIRNFSSIEPSIDMISDEEFYSQSSVVYIDDDYDSGIPGWQIDHFDSIQDGINAVVGNGIVYVNNGIYYESVTLNKTLNIIGENRDNTIIDGDGALNIILIASENSQIVNFTALDGVDGMDIRTDDCIIQNNKIIQTTNAIRLHNAYNNTIHS